MTKVAEPVAFTLRPAGIEDEQLILEILRNGRSADPDFLRCDVEQQRAIVRFEHDIQLQALAAVFPRATTSVIVIDGHAAGRLIVDRSSGVRLIDIDLLPRFRGAGIGTEIIRGLCEEAAAANVELSLRVAVVNEGARRLYERLGFRCVELDGAFLEMEWRSA